MGTATKEKVAKLGLERDYKTYLYFIDAAGNICRRAKHNKEAQTEIVVSNAVQRDNNFMYFIDADGDVSRTPRAARTKATA